MVAWLRICVAWPPATSCPADLTEPVREFDYDRSLDRVAFELIESPIDGEWLQRVTLCGQGSAWPIFGQRGGVGGLFSSMSAFIPPIT
jgi:hypothetical protein